MSDRRAALAREKRNKKISEFLVQQVFVRANVI